MPTFTDKNKNDLSLQIRPFFKQIHETQPTMADAFEKRITEGLLKPADLFLDKLDAIRTSGRYSAEGERKERRLAVQAFIEGTLTPVRAATVGKLETQIQEQRAAFARKKTTTPTDPQVAEMRAQEMRALLRSLNPIDLAARIRLDDGTTGLLDALEGAPAGFPIAPPQLIADARTRIAEANHPELGQLAALRSAYSFALGVVEQTVLAASGLTEREVSAAPRQEVAR